MKKKYAYVLDAYSKGNYHEVINQGYLMMISELYEKVVYVAERSSCKNLKQLLDSCGFDYSNVAFVGKDYNYKKFRWAGFNYIMHLIAVSWNNFKLYMQTPKGCDVFYNNNLYFATSLISIFAKNNENRIIVICHNELEYIDPAYGGTHATKILGAYFRHIFQNMKIDKKIRFIVLSSSMAVYFRSLISPFNRDRIGWIDHCYIRPENNVQTYDKLSFNGIKIGIPGLISPKRGLPEIKMVLKGLTNDMVKVYSISSVTEHIKDSHFQELNYTGGLLPFSQYNWYVTQMDAIALFYKPGSYKLTASGAVLEAIWNEKPIIAFENEYFKYLFLKFGPLGILCKNTEEFIFMLNHISLSQINIFKDNLRRAKINLLPKSQKMQLLKEINN